MPAPAGAAASARPAPASVPAKKARRAVPSVRQGPLPSPEAVARLADLSSPHVHSFSHFLDTGLAECVRDIAPREVVTKSGDT